MTRTSATKTSPSSWNLSVSTLPQPQLHPQQLVRELCTPCSEQCLVYINWLLTSEWVACSCHVCSLVPPIHRCTVCIWDTFKLLNPQEFKCEACCVSLCEHGVSNGRSTVTVEYGCFRLALDRCIGYKGATALLDCCYSDFCNRNFSRLLASEHAVNTMPPTTPAPSKRAMISN